MEKNSLVQLTTNLYRLTLFFPKKEPLRYKMRELADEILAESVLMQAKNPSSSKIALEIEKKLEVLDSFFEVAKTQNWVSPSDILLLQQEYSKVREDLEIIPEFEPQPENYGSRTPLNLPEREIIMGSRQEKILKILKEKGKAQVWEIKKIFPEVTKRTLRRDFEFLLKQGIIERIGERNETFYQIKG